MMDGCSIAAKFWRGCLRIITREGEEEKMDYNSHHPLGQNYGNNIRVRNRSSFLANSLDFWGKYKKNRLGIVALGFIVVFSLLSVLASHFSPDGPFGIGSEPLLSP
ncbi:MAG: hypothetical protein ACRD47_16910, partial [Nitrososphaeraceae archaeon]